MKRCWKALALAAVFWTTVTMSAYTPYETGSRRTASGEDAVEGYTCAANFVPIGSLIIYNGVTYHVQDRMNPSHSRHVDIFMESRAGAGVRPVPGRSAGHHALRRGGEDRNLLSQGDFPMEPPLFCYVLNRNAKNFV